MNNINKSAPRFESFSLEMQGGTGEIIAICTCSSFAEVYKIDKTFHVQTPEILDPHITDPNMGCVVKDKDNVGCSNKIVARLMVQSQELIKNLPLSINHDTVLDKLYQCKELLLICERISLDIVSEVNAINKQIADNSLAVYNRVINHFPQVENLEDKVSRFLANSKKYIQTLTEIFNILYGENVDGPHFHKIKKILLKQYDKSNRLYKYVEETEPYIESILELRNRIEHPKKGEEFIINNFILLPNKLIQPPEWYINGQEPCPIKEQMVQIVNDLLRFAEEFTLLCILEKIDEKIPYSVVEIPEKNRQVECPIRFNIQIDIARLFKKK